jgi:23S rRNA G2445 N2-methylase RlmL
MRKHEISYHEHSDDISFLSNYCKHLKASERSFSILSIQRKEMMQEIKQEKNDFKLIRILKRNENIEIHLSVNQSNEEMKNSNDVVMSLKKKKRKRKKSKMSKSIRNESTDSKIYMIEAASFH